MSFETEINEAIKNATIGEDGKTTYPKDTNENVAYAANLEKRRRDTQTSLQQSQQRGDKLEVENTKLVDTWEAQVAKTLTTTQRDELEELKNTDAEAWREQLNKYEADNKKDVQEKRKKIKEEAHNETELQRRERLIKEYNESNPGSQLTDDVIDNDLPPRMTKKLAAGKITFDEFITEATAYLGKGKVIGGDGDRANDDPDLSNLGGAEKPAEESVKQAAQGSYKGEIY